MAQINFGGSVEEVVTREEFPLNKAQAEDAMCFMKENNGMKKNNKVLLQGIIS